MNSGRKSRQPLQQIVPKSGLFTYEEALLAPSDLQLPLRQCGAGNVYLLVLSKAKR
jgi:hypothetical protein